jgi:uncharacterized RDD family membrane protein YckC
MLAFGFAAGFTVLCGYDEKANVVSDYYIQYETQYGVDFDISEEEYNALSDADKAVYNDAYKALYADEGFQQASQDVFELTMLMYGGAILCAYLLWFFVIPLLFGYGRTLGKKMFGLAVIRTNCVKASQPVLFIRTTVGLFAIETLFPLSMLVMIWYNLIDIVGLIAIGLLLILQVAMLIVTSTNSSIHDLLTDTVVIDFASQQIFDTQDDLLSHQQEQHAKAVEKAEYGRLGNE